VQEIPKVESTFVTHISTKLTFLEATKETLQILRILYKKTEKQGSNINNINFIVFDAKIAQIL